MKSKYPFNFLLILFAINTIFLALKTFNSKLKKAKYFDIAILC